MTSPIGGSGRRGVQSVTGRISGAGELDAGARAFYELSKRLKQAGGSGKGSIRSEMHKAVKQAAKPLPKKVKDEARRRFPQSGGLNRVMAKRTPKVVTRTGVQTAGVRIQDKSTDARVNEQGRVWHPVFGRRKPGKIQEIPAVEGYFDEPLRESAPQVRDEIVDVLADFAQKLVRGI